jgi:hypothetical protein
VIECDLDPAEIPEHPFVFDRKDGTELRRVRAQRRRDGGSIVEDGGVALHRKFPFGAREEARGRGARLHRLDALRAARADAQRKACGGERAVGSVEIDGVLGDDRRRRAEQRRPIDRAARVRREFELELDLFARLAAHPLPLLRSPPTGAAA